MFIYVNSEEKLTINQSLNSMLSLLLFISRGHRYVNAWRSLNYRSI